MDGTYSKEEIWLKIKLEVLHRCDLEPELKPLLFKSFLDHSRFESSFMYIIAEKIQTDTFSLSELQKIFSDIIYEEPILIEYAIYDLLAYYERDPTIKELSYVLLFCKGYTAIQVYRFSHFLWKKKKVFFAAYFQNVCSELFAVDIHPGSVLGKGVFIDHATSIVIGETAVVGDNVSLLHEVTLGGTGKDSGDRHPKVESNVLIGAGAKILGNVRIGKGSKVGAGSVVLMNVPPNTTVAGVPATVIDKLSKEINPASDMDQNYI